MSEQPKKEELKQPRSNDPEFAAKVRAFADTVYTKTPSGIGVLVMMADGAGNFGALSNLDSASQVELVNHWFDEVERVREKH